MPNNPAEIPHLASTFDINTSAGRTAARAYLRESLDAVQHLAHPGGSEYVVRSSKVPDARLDFPQQRLWMRMRRVARERRANLENGLGGSVILADTLEIAQIVDTGEAAG